MVRGPETRSRLPRGARDTFPAEQLSSRAGEVSRNAHAPIANRTMGQDNINSSICSAGAGNVDEVSNSDYKVNVTNQLRIQGEHIQITNIIVQYKYCVLSISNIEC